MGYPNKGCSYPDLKNGAAIPKTDQDKLKQFAKQLKSVFATKIELKDKNLERGIGNFLILNIQDYSPLKITDDQEELISINDIDKIINNLDIKKAPGIDRINNKLFKISKIFSFLFQPVHQFWHSSCKMENSKGNYVTQSWQTRRFSRKLQTP